MCIRDRARGDFDDCYMMGLPEDVEPVLVQFERDIAAVGGKLNRIKSQVLCGDDCVLPRDFPVGRGCLSDDLGAEHYGYGIYVAGVPVGDDSFVIEALKRKGDELDTRCAAVLGQLNERHTSPHHLFAVTRSCVAAWTEYWSRLSYPRHVAEVTEQNPRPLLVRADERLKQLEQISWNADLSPDGPLGPVGAALQQERIKLSVRMRGTGIREQVEQCRINFASSLLFVLPRLCDRHDANGTLVSKGLAKFLEDIVGANSFDEGNEHTRMAHFLERSGVPEAEYFKECWQAGVERSGAMDARTGELGDATANPFCHPIEAAGLRAAEGTHVIEKIQKTLTFACEEHEYNLLVDKFKAHLPDPALPFAQHTPLQRTALAFVNCDRFVNRWAVCIPSRKHCSSAREWYEIVANSMGLVSPACAPHVGELVHANGTRQQGVRLDAHGDALKTLSPTGTGCAASSPMRSSPTGR